ncbi:EfeM/EfeO family lipoprotein [Streptomyces sp. NBC_01497]|uniref:EfeM/EfeO family lipoprotein n=1 Tax=Streptomyces sp. NBC_01497 TaxID=2903885 RepID=UPI002E352065|nr:EfeM/EfeO family lipoprotein [Streptomyces sp. NBC_01497]
MPIRNNMQDASSPAPPDEQAPDGRPVRRVRRGWVVFAACVVVAAAGGVLALGLTSGNGEPAATSVDVADGLRHTAVEASASSDQCGKGWTDPKPGLQVFDVHNVATDAAEVYLTDSSGALLGEIDGLGPGTTRPIQVQLGRGSYAFRCLIEDTDAVNGPAVRVTTGPAKGGPAVSPVNQHDVIPPTLAYQKWVGEGFKSVLDKVGTLKAAVDAGDLDAARRAWLPAHLAYTRLGGAYGAFGDLGAAVDETDAGLPAGVHDKDFSGFHRVEYGLWHGQSAADLKAPTDQLAKDLKDLSDQWAGTRMDPLDTGLRAHEITEDSIQLDLTGRSDFGSGTSYATARAGLDGTVELLDVLQPLLAPRDPGLPQLKAALATAQGDLDATRKGSDWRAPDTLSRAERERVDADFGDLAERLAPVAVIFDIRRTS